MDADVVVVGAGLSGLSAAQALLAHGLSVTVLERDEVVGGRQHTDRVDGFLLDRGFQVLNPAYPALAHGVDVAALGLQRFGAGVVVRREAGLATLAHPLRHPRFVLASLRSGLLRPRELAALARWVGPTIASPKRAALAGPDVTVEAGWARSGVDGVLRREVLEPFIAGVVVEDRLETSDSFARLLVRMFALGVPGLPRDGMQALPAQLRGRVEAAGGTVRTGTPVVDVRSDGAGVTLEDGTVVAARAVVVAVSPEVVSDLVDAERVTMHGLTTWWFATDEAPSSSDMLAVDGTRSGPLVNTTVVSNAAPSYAPPGRHLVEATALIHPGTHVGDDEAREHAGRIWGASTTGWELLARHDVPHALPAQPAPLRLTSPPRLGSGAYVCGDHRDTASIQGAIVSGRRVAQAVAADLSG